MRNFLIAATAMSGLAAALPQKINIGAALAVSKPSVLGPQVEEKPNAPVKYNQPETVQEVKQSVSSSGVQTRKRSSTCTGTQETGGYAPVPGDGSVSAYLDQSNALRTAAQGAGTPTGYTKSFSDLTAATQQIGYLTYKNIESPNGYDVGQCASFCDSEKFCLGFNIYYERDPKYTPTSDCADPVPQTNLKCALFGYPVAANSATNSGQYREQFQVVIAGSNGYSKLSGSNCKPAPSVADFNAPTDLPAAINAPFITKNGQQYDTYNGMRLFNDNPYDPSLCAAACEAQTTFDKEHLADSNGEYKPCNFFTSYVLTQNGVPLGTYCALYTQSWDSSYAVNTGYSWESDTYSVICAASYSATNPDSGKLTTTTTPA